MRKQIQHATCLFGIMSIFFLSCQKQIKTPQTPEEEFATVANSVMQDISLSVYVANVDELYTAINDPANEGKTIVLAQGTYQLKDKDANGHAYPNKGRIELQKDMSLLGDINSPGTVVIDATAMPDASFILPAIPNSPFQGVLRTGVVRMGNGNNKIQGLTLYNDPSHLLRALIQTDLATTSVTNITITNTVVSGARVGINIANRDINCIGRTIIAVLKNNKIIDNELSPPGSGIQIQNSHGVTGGEITVVMEKNIISGNKKGIFVLNSSCKENKITVRSKGDEIFNNVVGLALIGGNSTGPEIVTEYNSTSFEADGTSIFNNGGPLQTENSLPGGVFAAGGIVPLNIEPGTVNNNKLKISFKDCMIANNDASFQINAFGAYSFNTSSNNPVGISNKTVVHLIGVSRNATVNPVASFPEEPAGTNTVNILTNN